MRAAQRALATRILSHYRPEVAGVAGLLRRPPRGDVERRLALYGEGYVARVREALLETFPALAHLAGDAAFTALTRRYCDAGAVGRSYNLGDAGDALPEFLAADPLSRQLPFAADLARLEWQIARAFHAEWLAPFDPSTASSWSPDTWQRARLHFQPSLAVVRSDWPIEILWRLRDVPICEIDVEVTGRPQSVLVFRSRLEVCVETIDDTQATALDLLMNGDRLGDVAERLAEIGHAGEAAFSWIARFQPHGLIAGSHAEV